MTHPDRYLFVNEIESGMRALAATYPDQCQLIELPNKTFEGGPQGRGRPVYALRLGSKSATAVSSVLFTGSAHAREWGGAETCLYFAADLLEAFHNKAGLQYGGKTYSAADVATIINWTNVFVVPVVNPDGREFSMRFDRSWRKNRNPANSELGYGAAGVDINRNFDFLWDFPRYFHSSVSGHLASTDPFNEKFHGSAPNSEPETRNIVWLLDNFPSIRWHMDIHCHAEELIYNWGMDQNQSGTPGMNFRNPAFDGLRGVDGDQYKEYIPVEDLLAIEKTATSVRSAIQAVRGKKYQARQGFYLLTDKNHPIPYATSGAVDDYVYSRHFADPSRGKVFGFTLEYSPLYYESGEAHPFNMDWEKMKPIILDVNAGMAAFCLRAFSLPRPDEAEGIPKRVTPKDLWGPYGPWVGVLIALLAALILNRVGRFFGRVGRQK